MKKITLLVAGMFLMGGVVGHAADRNDKRSPVDFRNADPIVFMERGVEFYIFVDGQLDFNTRPSNGEMHYGEGRRNFENRSYGNRENYQGRNYGVKIEHDNMGRVRRVGNVFVNYDAFGRIKRVGSVFMNYNRYALTQVGGLQIIYNRRGQIVDMVGAVNGGRAYQYNQNDHDDNHHNYGYSQQNSNDEDNTYYRTNGGKPKVTGSLDIRINN